MSSDLSSQIQSLQAAVGKLSQAKEGIKAKLGEVPFGTYHLGKTVFLEEPTWFFAFTIVYFIVTGAAISLGIYALYQWSQGKLYSDENINFREWVFSAMGLAIAMLITVIIVYWVYFFDKDRRVDDEMIERQGHALIARFLAKRAYDVTSERVPGKFKELTANLVDKANNVFNEGPNPKKGLAGDAGNFINMGLQTLKEAASQNTKLLEGKLNQAVNQAVGKATGALKEKLGNNEVANKAIDTVVQAGRNIIENKKNELIPEPVAKEPAQAVEEPAQAVEEPAPVVEEPTPTGYANEEDELYGGELAFSPKVKSLRGKRKSPVRKTKKKSPVRKIKRKTTPVKKKSTKRKN